ncbi:hypothetical protein ABZZ36_01225 [Actinacidiphila glaucinigra]|uniref:hypothetical protein n=1 Tax=Actinacidiphila glaucinigra TaxID=235986 RepID=UPI0033BD193A
MSTTPSTTQSTRTTMPETTRTPEAVTVTAGSTRPHPRATDRPVAGPYALDGEAGARPHRTTEHRAPTHRTTEHRAPTYRTTEHRAPTYRTTEHRTPTHPPRERGTRTPVHPHPHPTTRRSATRHHRGVRPVGVDRWSRPCSRTTPRHG